VELVELNLGALADIPGLRTLNDQLPRNGRDKVFECNQILGNYYIE